MPEPEGFDDFVRACSSQLYRVACLLTGGDRARAEDLVAESLARVYLAWPRIRDGDAFGYARRVVVNLHTDWWRRLRRRRETLTDAVPEVGDSTDRAREAANRDGVTRSLRRLAPRERAVVVLRYFLDLSEQATAAELGISLGAVKSTNARALAKLRVSPDLVEPTRSAIQPTRVGGPLQHRES